MYEFIDLHKEEHSVEKMADTFDLSRSSYYAAKKRPECKRKQDNRALLEKIQTIFNDSRNLYGSPKVYHELQKQGVPVGINRVAKLMKTNRIRAKSKKKWKATTNSNHDNPVTENLLDRNFSVDIPDKVWVSDITYIPTAEGWLYLCVIIDLWHRKVIGWNMSERCTKELVIQALKMALLNNKPVSGAIFHSDRGVQYTCKTFQNLLADNGFTSSMSRKGNCWDNACAESFFHLLKTEEVHHHRYKTRKEARSSIFSYIVFYNIKRIHSALGYLSPLEYEKIHRA